MNLSHEKRSMTKFICPNLLEWPGGRRPVCRLRYRVSADLTTAERIEFCENKAHEKCAYYAEQIKQCTEIYTDHHHIIQ